MDFEFVYKFVKMDYLEIKVQQDIDNVYQLVLMDILLKLIVFEDVF